MSTDPRRFALSVQNALKARRSLRAERGLATGSLVTPRRDFWQFPTGDSDRKRTFAPLRTGCQLRPSTTPAATHAHARQRRPYRRCLIGDPHPVMSNPTPNLVRYPSRSQLSVKLESGRWTTFYSIPLQAAFSMRLQVTVPRGSQQNVSLSMLTLMFTQTCSIPASLTLRFHVPAMQQRYLLMMR